MGKHKEAMIVGFIFIAILGCYHFVYVPQLISQAKQEQSDADNQKIKNLNSEISSYQSVIGKLQSENKETKSKLENANQQIQNTPQNVSSYSYDTDDEVDDLNFQLDRQEEELQELKDKYNDAEDARYHKELNEWLDNKRDMPPKSPDYEY